MRKTDVLRTCSGGRGVLSCDCKKRVSRRRSIGSERGGGADQDYRFFSSSERRIISGKLGGRRTEGNCRTRS